MAQSAIDRISPGTKLDALTAEKVFGWKDVHKHEGTLVGKKQDKAGRWRLAKVPYYSTKPRPCIFDRGSNETPRAIEPIPERTRQDYSLQKYSLGLGFPGSTLPGSDQSYGTVRLGRSFEQESQTASKIEFRVLVTLETLTFYSNATATIRSAHFIPPELPRLLPS
jgi:hypothetical protein